MRVQRNVKINKVLWELIIESDLHLCGVCQEVQNGLALYATWTTIATHINLTIVLDYDAEMLPGNAAMVTLSVLTCVLLAW